jgi:outer membrane immunogenic protein
MRKYLLGAVAAALMAAPAMAADMPVKASPRVVAEVWTWTGIYFGANGGWHREKLDWAFNPALAAAPNQSFSLSTDSWIVGAHVGANWQFNQIVLGVEAAGSWLSDREARHFGYGVGNAFAVAHADQLFTIGARLGWSPWAANNWLFYVTGGYANGLIRTKNVGLDGVESGGFRTDERHGGWYAGAGIEYQIWRNWIVGVEYQHVDLQTKNHCRLIANVCNPADTNNHDMSAKIDIVRARLSWKFDMPTFVAPVVARY